MFQPIIKWSGSKRSQGEKIVGKFPQKIKTYYEPFVGGGSVLRWLLESGIEAEHYYCSDLNDDLIALWKEIKDNPSPLIQEYESMWRELNVDSDLERKKQYFYSVRSRYNKTHSPKDFLFIMRTTTNGMPRYNGRGEFNNSFHVTRNGIEPDTLYKIAIEWSKLLQMFDVQFFSHSFEKISSVSGDVLYLDPPYFATKGMYYGRIEYDEFWNWMRNQGGKCFLSFDGKVKEQDFTHQVPADLYKEHIYLDSGNSSFRRVIGNSNDSRVFESLYVGR